MLRLVLEQLYKNNQINQLFDSFTFLSSFKAIDRDVGFLFLFFYFFIFFFLFKSFADPIGC